MIPKQEKHSLATNQIIDETIPSKIVSKIMETSIKTLKVLIFLKVRDGRVYPFEARVTRYREHFLRETGGSDPMSEANEVTRIFEPRLGSKNTKKGIHMDTFFVFL